MFKSVLKSHVLPDRPRGKLVGSHGLVDPGQSERLKGQDSNPTSDIYLWKLHSCFAQNLFSAQQVCVLSESSL